MRPSVVGFGAGTAVAALVMAVAPLAAQQVVDLPAADRRLNANFEEVYRVGSMDAELWATFGNITGTAFDGDGNLYIFDQQATRIVKVDPQGNHVMDIGRPGEGPGELRMPFGFTVLRDGTVVVGDLGHRAFTLYGPDGEFVRSVSMGAPGTMTLQMGPYLPDPNGGGVIVGGAGGVQMRMGGPGMAEPTTRPIERLSLAGDATTSELLAEGWLPPPLEATEEASLGGSGGGFQVRMPPPRAFEPPLLVAAVSGGAAYVDSTAYEINVVDSDGSRVLRRPIAPEAVTPRVQEAERERRVAEIEEQTSSSGGGARMMVIGSGGGSGGGSNFSVNQDDMRRMRLDALEGLVFFPEVPVIRSLTSSWNGALWVQRRGEEPVSDGPIDIVSPDGGYVGTFASGETDVPDAFGPNGFAAFIEMDEYDVPTIVVRRLPGAIN